MFENSFVVAQRKRGVRRWLSLPLAVALHLVVLSGLVFAQYWSLETLPEPQVTEAFQVALPPPPPPAARRGTAAPQTVRHQAAPTAAPTPTPTRPTQPTTPSDRAVPLPEPPSDDQVGIPDGVVNGDPNGDPDGDPNGVLGGVRGAVPLPQPPIDDQAVPFRNEMTKPRVVYSLQPQYTEVARRARLQGTVIVQAVIDESGRVLDVQVLKRLGMGLDRSAADAVAQWRFTPATLNGRPLKVIYTLTVNFTVQ
jgi:protein TonB